MFLQIYELIKKYENIVIARHIGVDPDAMASSFALKNSILLTFPNKHVRLAGTGSNRFSYFGKLDKNEDVKENTLLIVTDTPDIKRIDGIVDITKFSDIVKIDHHPFIERFSDLEYVDPNSSSAAELVLRFFNENQITIDKEIAEFLFYGIISDTNRFLFNYNSDLLRIIADLVDKYGIEVENLYKKLYARPFSEVRFQGFISEHLTLTDNGFAYVIVSNDTLIQYGVDSSSAGNMVNSFNNIDEVLVWATISEDVKNNQYKFNIRSRGPVVNTIAEKYNGGGHKMASGARVKTLDEAMLLVKDLDLLCKEYKEKEEL